MKETSSNEKSSSALRALSIIELVAGSAEPISATEITQKTGLPKPTAHRLCLMLRENGYLQSSLDGRGFIPGSRTSRLAMEVITNNDQMRAERHEILQRLSEDVGETCNISVPDGTEMIYFDRVETHWPLRVQLQINDRVPMYCTASGKLFINNLTSVKRRRLINRLTLEQRTPNTITDVEVLKKELKRIRRDDIGVDNEEFIQGMVAVAVPLKSDDGKFYGCLAMHAPTVRMDVEQAMEKIPRMKEAAKELVSLI